MPNFRGGTARSSEGVLDKGMEHGRQEPIALFCLDGHPRFKSVQVPQVNLSSYRGLTEGGR
jgi:hypothetical protein